MNKTTSFSKILATKKTQNNVLNGYAPDTTPLATNSSKINQQYKMNIVSNNKPAPQPPPITDSFFIDSINENNLNNNKQQIIFDHDPEFSEIENQPQQMLNNTKDQGRIKNWKSESNLVAMNQTKLNEFNKSLNEHNEYADEEEYDDYENFDYYIDGINVDDTGLEDEVSNEPLQFSDHAGIYDPYENDEVTNSDDLNESKYLNEHKRRMLLDNYDVYTKKNYKLTYNKPHISDQHHQNSQQAYLSSNGSNYNTSVKMNKMLFNSESLKNSDSVESSAIMQQSSNLDGSNYLEDEDVDEDDDDEEQVAEDEESARLFINHNILTNPSSRSNAAMFKNDYYSYLNALKNQNPNLNAQNSDFFSSMNSSNQQISDSIMNWSMKISNYNQNHYIPDTNRMRSKSRSPPTSNLTAFPRSNSSFSKFYNQSNILEDSVTLSPPIEFRNKNNKKTSRNKSNIKNNLVPANKSTTSWGKLKHSKSSSSNIGCSTDDHDASSQTTQTADFSQTAFVNNENVAQYLVHRGQAKPYRKERNFTTNIATYEYAFANEQPHLMDDQTKNYLLNQQNIQNFQRESNKNSNLNVNHNSNNMSSTNSSPSLFKLFQNSRATVSTNNIQNLNSDEFSSETNSSNGHNVPKQKVKQKKHENSQKQKSRMQPELNSTNVYTNRRSQSKQNHDNPESIKSQGVRTTSFSQLRQRSLSSCAIGTSTTDFANQTFSEQNHSSTSSSINQSMSTNSTSNNSIIRKSVGIQHPPMIIQNQSETIVCMVVDKNSSKTNEELMAVAARAAQVYKRERTNGMYNAKSSLPDLTFLKDYADEKPDRSKIRKEAVNQQIKTSSSAAVIANKDEKDLSKQVFNPFMSVQTPTPVQPMGSDLLKRKTLKSIKRYRQTKQNTEPCNTVMSVQNIENIDLNQSQLTNQYTNSNNDQINISSTSSSSGSGTNSNCHYQLTDKKEKNHLTPNYQPSKLNKEKQPLKSCLKRKDSQSSSQSQSSSKTTMSGASPNINQSRRSKSSAVHQSSMIITNKNKYPLLYNQTKYTLMFVPFVGFLFTHDKGSSNRYAYYNKLELSRRYKMFCELTSSMMYYDENDDDDDEEESDLNRNLELQQGVSGSKSDNDLRVKKSVTFLAQVIEYKQQLRNRSSGESSSVSSSALTTPTATSPHHVVSNKLSLSKQTPELDTNKKSDAPLLQYNALIAMLKSNALQNKKKQEEDARYPVNAQFVDLSQVQKKNIHSPQKQNKAQNLYNKPQKISNIDRRGSDEYQSYFKSQSQIIDADSISLGSLSESPPSEFKFSDDEGNDSDAENVAALKAANNFTQNIKGLRKDPDFPQKRVNNKTESQQTKQQLNNNKAKNSAQIMELSKNIQQQQIKLNQLELLRNRKKNFHSILLKDTKLNNLKEILFEIKQHQQKLAIISQQKRELQQTPLKVNTAIISSLENKTLEMSALNVSIELRDTIDHLSQYLFEFLKQGLRSESLDTSQNHNMSASNLASPPTSPTNDKPTGISDSSSLSITYSQYNQIWNLIESTINSNISLQSPKHQNAAHSFHLPKEAYVNMFQEINNYANNTNQTYLIDSGINTSQLRRKHHFMVMLKGLKFKYQLFIVNLLNYKQVANWFEYLNKDKNVLKKYYDLKFSSSSSNNSGDSGVGEFLCTSGSSSLSSSLSLSQNHNTNPVNSSNLLASLSVTSLQNVSIFENEEYFNYYHKLLQQFNFIEFNLTSFNVNHEKYILSAGMLSPPPSTSSERKNNQKQVNAQKPAIPIRKPNSNKRNNNSNHSQNHNTLPNSLSTPNAAQLNTSTNNNGVLKSISKRFNIKSWFSNSSNHSNTNNVVASPGLKQKQILSSQSSTSQSSSASLHKQQAPKFQNSIPKTPPQSTTTKLSYYDTTPTSNCCQNISHLAKHGQNQNKHKPHASSTSLMKHSLSEPSLNALIN